MKLPIKRIDQVPIPNKNSAFAFIDADDKKLKVRKHDSIIEFTNSLDDVQLLNLCDYTAFEVFAHNYDIPSGRVSTELGGYITNPISACMTHSFTIRSEHNVDDQNVIIDWGDGIIENLRDIVPTSNSSKTEFDYLASHTYSANRKIYCKIIW